MSINWGASLPGVVARPIDKADASALLALLHAAEQVDRTGEVYDLDDVEEELADAHLDLQHDTIGLWLDAEMIGYSIIRAFPNAIEQDRVRGEGTVRPDLRGKGIGGLILDWQLVVASVVHERTNPGMPAVLSVNSQAGNEQFGVLAAKKGFRPVRHFFEMRRPFDQELPAPLAPDGLQIYPYENTKDNALRLTHNEAFLDHWGYSPRTQEFWEQWVTGSRAFRSDISFLACDGDRIVAYAIGYEYEAETAAKGVREQYFGQVGTLRDYRGRGTARALLLAAMRAARDLGYQRAALGVDSESPTGALGLYERLGFVVYNESVAYQKPL